MQGPANLATLGWKVGAIETEHVVRSYGIPTPFQCLLSAAMCVCVQRALFELASPTTMETSSLRQALGHRRSLRQALGHCRSANIENPRLNAVTLAYGYPLPATRYPLPATR